MLLLGALAVRSSVSAEPPASIDYPEDYRDWTHIKSTLISPAHTSFAMNGGFQHIYANDKAAAAYRTRDFPEGSVIVFEWLEMSDKAGFFEEGPRRQVDVMVKDSKRFAATGGWGFERFMKDSKVERAPDPPREQCFACHVKLQKNGLVLSTYRD